MSLTVEEKKARRRAREITRKHIDRVREIMSVFTGVLDAAAFNHDKSKFDEIELGPLAKMQQIIDRDGQAEYGSDEYKKRTKILGPMLKHHYANNPHHPEHHKDGMDGMDLFYVVEMFADWKAASERGEQAHMSLSKACEKYEVSDQLKSIFENTAKRMGWAYE